MIPTTPWEAPFRGIASWLGISESDMGEVCPNLSKFNSTYLIDVDKMFRDLELSPSQTPHATTTIPSLVPSEVPSLVSTEAPSIEPTLNPSKDISILAPSLNPSNGPSITPRKIPSEMPTTRPTSPPTINLSTPPSSQPSNNVETSNSPSSMPSKKSTTRPTSPPSVNGVITSSQPSNIESLQSPSNMPSTLPSIILSLPTSRCPLDCSDSTTEKFFIDGVGKRNCAWAVRKPGLKDSRCALPEVGLNCCESCCTLAPSEAPSQRMISPAPSGHSLVPSSLLSCPSDCKGDATLEKFPITGIGNRSCDWAIRVPDKKESRCALPEVALNCCKSCCTSCVGDAAGNKKFDIPERGIKAKCSWATKKNPNIRCALDSVSRMCCFTCAKV